MDGIIIVDKKKGWTSQDILTKIKRTKKFDKIGHAGTLDPLATGVMVVMINGATKLSDYLMSDSKEYVCEIVVGVSTDTEDCEGEIIESKEVVELHGVDEVLKGLVGELVQTPPMFSSVHHEGKKLYEYAREGIVVNRKPRKVNIYDISILNEVEYFDKKAKFSFKTKVSKGTYIRTLCVEIGKRLGYPAHMNELRRIASGNMLIENASTLEDVLAGNFQLINMIDVFKDKKIIEVDEQLDNKIKFGMKVEVDCTDEMVIFTKNKQLYAIYQKDNQLYRAKRIWI
ncbi:MAG: tRNA pseudouridine(55) synthase TruB [Bacilli bacterium]